MIVQPMWLPLICWILTAFTILHLIVKVFLTSLAILPPFSFPLHFYIYLFLFSLEVTYFVEVKYNSCEQAKMFSRTIRSSGEKNKWNQTDHCIVISKSLLCAHQTQLANQEHSNQTWPEAQGHIVISSLYCVEAVTIMLFTVMGSQF